MNYEELLNKAYEKLPEHSNTEERFEIPQVQTMIEGNATIIVNFTQVAQDIRRDPKHLLKFLSKELAAPGSLEGVRAILQSKIPKLRIQQKLEAYIKEYVLCKECGKPDTKLEKQDRFTFLKCEACGAKAGVR